MSEQGEDIGRVLREAGWRQGSVLSPAAIAILADLLPSSTTAAVVTSQDCDIVRDEGTEPHIEIIWGRSWRHLKNVTCTCATSAFSM